MGFQTVAPRRRRLDRRDAIFQHDGMRRLLESQSRQPSTMHQRPRWPMVVMAMAQQESRELLTGLAQVANGRQTRTHEIADRLMSRIGNPDGGQFTRPMQLGQIDRIAPIRLDPISRLARDQRRSHDDAAMSRRGSTAVESHSRKVRPHNRTEARSRRATASPPERSRPSAVRDLAVLAHLLAPARLGKRDRNRVLMNVKANICDSSVQGPSPSHEALRRNPGATLDKPAYCDTGRPISGEHVV